MADVDERKPRDRSRERSGSRDRRRRSRSRDRERRRSRSRDRRSRSRDRRRSRSRSKSPAYDPNRKRRRPTWFDIQPVGGVPPPIQSLPGAVEVTPPIPASLALQSAGGNQQATRHARRIYVGGLPPNADETSIATFFSNALAAVGGTTAGPGPCVMNVYINQEKKFAFVELRTVEEASNGMALDGILFEGSTVRIRRPADYNAAAAAALGPAAPNPNLNLAAIGLDKLREQQAAAAAAAAAAMPQQKPAPPPTNLPKMPEPNPDRLFVGGLPYYLNDEQCRELLGSFGAIKTFDLIKDRETGGSKGYGFVLYEDTSVTDLAIHGLNGMKMGDRQLTVKRADQGARNAMPVVPAQVAPDGSSFQPAMFTAVAPRVVKLSEAVTIDELRNDEDYNDIMEDMREEFAKFGAVKQVLIPRPVADASQPPSSGLGKVLVEFVDPQGASAARNAMHGRRFGGRTVQASLVTEEDWLAGNYD